MKKGFTIIELVVVMAVFLFIVGTAMAIFISIIRHERQIASRQELLNQTSYALEYMSKALRMAGKSTDETASCIPEGYVYQLGQDTTGGKYTSIKFINNSDFDQEHQRGICQQFCIQLINSADRSQGYVLKEVRNAEQSASDCGSKEAVNVTSAKLVVNSLGFVLNGNPANSYAPLEEDVFYQPRVTVFMDVKAYGDENQPSIKLQTTVSERDLNK